MVLFITACLGVTGAIVYVVANLAGRERAPRTSSPAPERPLDVVMIDVAMPVAALVSLRSDVGREAPFSAHVARVARSLLDRELSWTHVGARSFPAGSPGRAHDRYDALVREANGRDAIEVAPRGDGYRGDDAPAPGPRYGLVSIVALSAVEIPEAPPASRATGRALLEVIADVAPHLVSGFVVWLPDPIEDGMSAETLAKKAPRVVAITP